MTELDPTFVLALVKELLPQEYDVLCKSSPDSSQVYPTVLQWAKNEGTFRNALLKKFRGMKTEAGPKITSTNLNNIKKFGNERSRAVPDWKQSLDTSIEWKMVETVVDRRLYLESVTFEQDEPSLNMFDCAAVAVYEDQKSILIEKRVRKAAHLYFEETSNFVAVGNCTMENAVIVGRIVSENIALARAEFTASDLLIQGNSEFSSGAVARLDCRNLDSFFLYPGQHVVMRGICGALQGDPLAVFYACDVRDPCIMEPAKPISTGGLPSAKLVICGGPYSSSTDCIDFRILSDMMHRIEKLQPERVLFCGPFLTDSSLTVNMLGSMNQSDDKDFPVDYRAIYAKAFSMVKELSVRLKDAAILVMPHTDDVEQPSPMPQLAFDREIQGIEMVGNPVRLDIGGTSCVVSATDVYQGFLGRDAAVATRSLNAKTRQKSTFAQPWSQGCLIPGSSHGMVQPALNNLQLRERLLVYSGKHLRKASVLDGDRIVLNMNSSFALIHAEADKLVLNHHTASVNTC